jgi:hypothetical protein
MPGAVALPKKRGSNPGTYHARLPLFSVKMTVFCGKTAVFPGKKRIYTSENDDRIWQNWGGRKGRRTCYGTGASLGAGIPGMVRMPVFDGKITGMYRAPLYLFYLSSPGGEVIFPENMVILPE